MSKIAIVKNDVICHIYPWEKTLPDGTKIIKELPPHYLKEGKHQRLLKKVPDDARPGWKWDGNKFVKPIKSKPQKRVDPTTAVLAEILGIDYNDLTKRIKEKRRDIQAKTD